MSKVIEVEKKKALAAGAKVSGNKFGGKAPRATELAGIKEGDVVTLPKDWEVLEQEIRGAQPDESGKKPVAQYVLVEVERTKTDGTKFTKAVPFYPSCLYKRAELAEKKMVDDPADASKKIETWVGTGNWQVASGSAADTMQEYATVDEFMDHFAEVCNPADPAANAPKRIKITKLPTFDVMTYSGDHRRTGIGQFDWI